MKFIPSAIPDILIVEPLLRGDERGFFMETFQARLFSEAGIPVNFVQDNHSGSRQNILRGLHYQIRHAQGKLFRVIAGEVFDVAVDLRRSSPTFKRWTGLTLSARDKRQVWVPPGFAHGFYVMSEWAEVIYKTTDFYAPDWERTLIWNDPEINIRWPLLDNRLPTLSAKDSQGLPFGQIELFD
jgi:dTDP-4-dehydrorhamnose 3,5-epimerase